MTSVSFSRESDVKLLAPPMAHAQAAPVKVMWSDSRLQQDSWVWDFGVWGFQGFEASISLLFDREASEMGPEALQMHAALAGARLSSARLRNLSFGFLG